MPDNPIINPISGSAGFLSDIIASKKKELILKKQRTDIDTVANAARAAGPALPFYDAVAQGRPPCIIAEIKRRSPSKGPLVEGLDVTGVARDYAAAGAAAISVLTDAPYFGGSLDDLMEVKRAVGIPVLRKDFIIDAFQIYESRAAGADTVLLIVRILGKELAGSIELARTLGMEPLVEVHDEDDLKAAIDAGARVIGINARDLETFHVDTGSVGRLARHIPGHIMSVAESGISSVDVMEDLLKSGINGFLIGEALMRARHPGDTLKEFIDIIRKNSVIERR